MYHIKHIKILSFSLLSAMIMAIIYIGGSIILFGSIIIAETDFFQHSSYMISDILDLSFFLPWIGIMALVFFGAWGLFALVAVLYNAFAGQGRGFKIDLEMIEEKK